MRIISGIHKGRHIPVRKNFPSRPTTDFAKENLFNILNNHFDLENLKVLDLFAGTGSISYEFASRGAIVTAVEINYRSYRYIQETAAMLKLENLRVIKADAFKFLDKVENKYDIVFADPPFQMKDQQKLIELVFENKLLNEDGWFILEHSDQNLFNGDPRLSERRSYGSVNFSVFQ